MILIKKYFSTTHRKTALQIQNIIKPMYIVASLMGLFPYSVTFVQNKLSFMIVRRSIYVNSLCGVTICLLIFAFASIHIKEVLMVNESINLTEAIVTQSNYVLEVIALVMFCVVAYLSAFLNRAKYVKMINQLTLTWNELPLNDNSNQILTYLQFQVNVICMTTLIVILVTQICVNFTRNNSLWKIVLVAITFHLPQTIQIATLGLYYMLVMSVVAIMMKIEWQCRHLQKDNKEAKDGFLLVQNQSTITLRQLKLIYVKVFEIKCDINEVFQGPILATALQCFHAMVSEAHIIYHGLVVQKTITTHEILNCAIWVVYQIIKIYSVAYSGNLLKLQALKIGQTLHNIPTEKRDSRWLLEIQHFSSLMYYQDIELNVYGYFPLNATFLYNMMASTTMYLIILVQFDKRDLDD